MENQAIKKCSVCGLEKPVSEFYSQKGGKFGVMSKCKNCSNQYGKQYHEEHKKEIKKYRETNRDKISQQKRLYHKEHKAHVSRKQKEYYNSNKDEISKNRKERFTTDIDFRITCNLRSRFRNAIKNGQKTGSAVKDLGCSIDFLKQYLETMFYNNPKTGEIMTWDNNGIYGWHIDHIIPLSYFDLSDREQLLIACHYKNLKPLWSKENLEKSDILPENLEDLLNNIKDAIKK